MQHSLPMKNKNQEKNAHWIPLSDLMTGLMMIFLLISISFIIHADNKSGHINHIESQVHHYQAVRKNLYNDLYKEFSKNFSQWDEEIEKNTLTIRFIDENTLFNTGEANITPYFKKILDDFFPRYINIVTRPEYRGIISDLRIEDHPSNEWEEQNPTQDIYYMANIGLSQERTRNVLEYILSITHSEDQKKWIRHYATANGLSPSKLLLEPDRHANKKTSKRLEFKIITNADLIVEDIQSTIDSHPIVNRHAEKTPTACIP